MIQLFIGQASRPCLHQIGIRTKILRERTIRQEINMAKTVSCRDVGMDCDFVARGETNEDIMRQAAEHARIAHHMNEIPAEVADKVRSAIRDEAA
jgi:predicted small metal-binding protein